MFFGRRKKAGFKAAKVAEWLDFDRVPDFLLEHEKWTPFVTRMAVYCGHLPSPDGSGTLAAGSVAAGCRAMSALDRKRGWEALVVRGPDESQPHFKARVQLGLFFAGCLGYLVPLLRRVDARVGGMPWLPYEESFTGFWKKWGIQRRGKSKGKALEVEVAWGNGVLTASEILVFASYFFTCQEVRYVWPAVARGVFDYILPGEFGIFDVMMSDDGHESGAKSAALEELVEGGDLNGLRAWEEG